MRGVGDGVFVGVVVDDAVDAGGVDGAEAGEEGVVVDEDPAGVFGGERVVEVGEVGEVG